MMIGSGLASSRISISARVQPSKRRVAKHPLIEIDRAKKKDDVLAGPERWRARHPEAAAHLQPADVLVDAMRGRHSTWTRIRVNLQHVPVELRPDQAPLDPDAEPDDWAARRADVGSRRRHRSAGLQACRRRRSRTPRRRSEREQ